MNLKKLLTRVTALSLTLSTISPASFAMFSHCTQTSDTQRVTPIILPAIQNYLRDITHEQRTKIALNFIRSYDYWKTTDSQKMTAAGNIENMREFINVLRKNLNNEDFYVILCAAISSGYNAEDLTYKNGFSGEEIRKFSEKANKIISTVHETQRAFVPHIMLENSKRVFKERKDGRLAIFYLHASILFIFLSRFSK